MQISFNKCQVLMLNSGHDYMIMIILVNLSHALSFVSTVSFHLFPILFCVANFVSLM